MSHVEDTKRFEKDVMALAKRYTENYDLTYAQIIGTLQGIIILLAIQAIRSGKGPDLNV